MSSDVSPAYSLPPEIWRLISKSLRPKSLNSLCRTSRQFLDLVRPALYHRVNLAASWKCHPEETLRLLCNDQNLAKHVLELALPSPWNPKSPFCFAAIQNMTSLKRLSLRGSIFNDAKEQELFERMSAQHPTLQEFEFNAVFHKPPTLPKDSFPLPNLTSLVWRVDWNTHPAPLLSLLEASQETLQTLNFNLGVTVEETYLQLWKMRFPRLKSLFLAIWWPYDAERAAVDFTDFIIAHKTLEELDLAYRHDDEYAMDFGRFGKLKSDSLPRLKLFKGYGSAFKEMAEARMDCLRTLHVLEICPGMGDDLEGLFDELDRWRAEEGPDSLPVLGSLKELRLDLPYWDESMVNDVRGALERCANLCGQTLEVWRGDITVPFHTDEHGFGFGKFERLRVIYLKERAIPQHSKIEDIALGIASENPLLEELIVAVGDFRAVGQPDVVARILRSEDKPVTVRLLPRSEE